MEMYIKIRENITTGIIEFIARLYLNEITYGM